MNAVTAQAFTGAWTPPISDLSVLQNGVNLTTATGVLALQPAQSCNLPAHDLNLVLQ